MAKEVIYDQDARAKILAGVDGLANAVRVTLGPKGRNVIIEKSFGSPTITKDGVTVAKEIEFEDKFENMGAQMVKEVASKTSDIAGDGTTTATVLAQAIFREGGKLVAAGMNPMDLKRGIDKAVTAIVDELSKIAKPTRDSAEIAQVGTISANSDETIGKILAEAMNKVFGTSPGPKVTSIKGVTGHALGAAGALEAAAVLLSMDRRLIPHTVGVTEPDPEIPAINLVRDEPAPWEPGPSISNSFGFGGHNGTLVLAPV